MRQVRHVTDRQREILEALIANDGVISAAAQAVGTTQSNASSLFYKSCAVVDVKVPTGRRARVEVASAILAARPPLPQVPNLSAEATEDALQEALAEVFKAKHALDVAQAALERVL